jgi:Ni/Fe-hydrogenase subunit HybB-like protein
MVLFEASLAYRSFKDKMDAEHIKSRDDLTFGFGRAASFVLIGYFAIKVFGVALGNHWNLLFTGYGLWFLLEMFGFVLLPAFMFAIGARDRNPKLLRITALITVLGIVLNRLNVSLIAFNYHLPASERYIPHWMEIGISVFVVTIGLVVYRFIVTRMPIFYTHPDYPEHH